MTELKLYQVGTFAAGNRLLEPSERTEQSDPRRTNSITSGHRACRGCGEALAARVVLDAAMRSSEGRMVTVNATGCLEVFSTPFPESAWRVPWMHSLFGNAAAVASGVAASRPSAARPCSCSPRCRNRRTARRRCARTSPRGRRSRCRPSRRRRPGR